LRRLGLCFLDELVDASRTHAYLTSDLSNREAFVIGFGHCVSSKCGELLDLALGFFHFSSSCLVPTPSVRNLGQHIEELFIVLVS